MFGIAFDIIFATVVIGGALFRFFTSTPGQRSERGCLLSMTIILFVIYFLVMPPEREEPTIKEIAVPAYLK